MDTAVIERRIIQADPTGEMGHGFRACPVGIILVPSHDATVVRWFHEELIMPEPNRAA